MRMARWISAAVLAMAIAPGAAWPQGKSFENAVEEISARFEPAAAKRGETVRLIVTVRLFPHWHTYPQRQVNPKVETQVNALARLETADLIAVEAWQDPPGPMLETRSEGQQFEYSGTIEWQMPVVISPGAQPGQKTFQVGFRKFLVCDEEACLPPRKELRPAALTISDAAPIPVEEKYRAEVDKLLSSPKPGNGGPSPAPADGATGPKAAPSTSTQQHDGKRSAPPVATLEEHKANLEAIKKQLEPFEKPTNRSSGGLATFLLTAAFWGLVSLITPCVFPMIPITVSFFLKQSEREHHKPVRMALVYCITIILVLGIAAMTLLTFFRTLSVHPATNIALGGLFLVFAFSLFGLYDITLPQSLTNFTAAREGRGGMLGTVFMALTFTIVSFTCVAPFLGGFAGMQSSGQYSTFELFLGAMAFSTTFAAPFFVLALFPALIKKLPKSGSWLNSVKVVMGFLELAAALKFFRTAELRLLPVPAYFTYDIVLGIWVALALVCGLYLLNLFRLGHDEPIEHVGVYRMLIGLGFLSLAIYLAPALFKSASGENQRPGGVVYAWIDSFLLPEPSEDELPWSANLKGTVDAARNELRKTGKRQFIFLDNTGVTCTNCKYNERTVFHRNEVRSLFGNYRLVQHYTDEVPENFYGQKVAESRREDEAAENLRFQRDVFGTEQLPLYVALEVTRDAIKVRDVYTEGKINDVNKFVEFLSKSAQ